MKIKAALLTMLLSMVSVSSVSAKQVELGDVDLDTMLTTDDALLILNYSLNEDMIKTELASRLADVDQNGRIDSDDALRVLIASRESQTIGYIDDGSDISDISVDFSVEGFGANVSGGGELSETDSKYVKVSNAEELGNAIKNNAKVIEITNDIDLGYNMLSSAAVKTGVFSKHNSPLTHPVLLQTGVSKVKLSSKSNMTIFSENGAKITHAGFDLSSCSNIMIRNIEFDELWEWDENTNGEYDRNDWDYMTLKACNKVWIDHCTFNKAYDGIVDVKDGSKNVTISWCSFPSDDCSEDSFVMRQMNYLEENMSKFPMYKYLRETVGFTKEEIAQVSAGQKKTHLVGSSEFASSNASLSVTLANDLYINSQDRMPRLRAGNAHVYNTVMDSSENRKNFLTLEDKLNAVSTSYHFGITSQGALSTEDGAVLVENSVMRGITRPLANNQKDASNALYTGKIKAENVLYELDGEVFNGGSDDENTPLVPDGADEIKEFSWNNMNTLPYSYTLIDTSVLEKILSDNAGSGKVSIDWLKVKYTED
jgi:pectate lyase